MNIKRYIYLDNLKWVLVMMVVIFHSSIAAEVDPIGFNLPKVIKSMQWQYQVLGTFNGMLVSFFMSLFFFISAYFVSSSLDRKGAGRFMLDKLQRLGIPVLATLLIISPIMAKIIFYFMPDQHQLSLFGVQNSNYVSILSDFINPLFKNGNIIFGVTWFTWTLIVFNAFFVFYKKIFIVNKSHVDNKNIPAIWKMFLFAIVMIPFNYLGLYLQHQMGDNFLGFRLLGNFPMYIVMFYFGIQAFKFEWLDQLEVKHAFWGILMWIFGMAFLGQIARGYGLNPAMMSRGFTVIGMSMFLLYMFKVLFDKKYKCTEIFSRAAFAAYVIQLVPLAFIASIYSHYMTQIPVINFIVLAVPSVILSFAIGYGMCKVPILKRIF